MPTNNPAREDGKQQEPGKKSGNSSGAKKEPTPPGSDRAAKGDATGKAERPIADVDRKVRGGDA